MEKEPRKINTDFFCGLFGLVFMGFFWLGKEGVGDLSIMFPNALLIIIGLLSVTLIIKGLAKAWAEKAAVFTEGDRGRMLVTAAGLFVWYLAAINVGFYVGSVIVFLAMVCYLAKARHRLRTRSVLLWLAVILVEVAIFDSVFSRFLHVPLPRGILF